MAALGTRRFDGITKADLEAVRDARRTELAAAASDACMRPGCKGGEVGIEHLMAVARQIWNWAILEGYVETTPFKRGGVAVIRVKTGASSPRTRRLDGDEEGRLIAASRVALQALSIEDVEKVGRIMTAWRAACRRAGIKDLHFHDLRREFASRLLESGASDHEVRDWLGHANITTTSRYLATTRVRLQRTMASFEAHRIA